MDIRLLRYLFIMVTTLAVVALPHASSHVVAANMPALHAYAVPTGFADASSAADPITGHTFIASDGQVIMADSASGIVLRRTSIGHGQQRVFVDSTRGRVLIYSDGGPGTASVSTIDAGTGLAIRTVNLNTAGMTGPMVLDQTTGRFFAGDWSPGNHDFVISVIDTWTGRLLRRMTAHEGAYSAFMIGDEASGRVLVLADDPASPSPADSYKLTVLDSSSGDIMATQELQISSDAPYPPLFTIDSTAGHVLIAEQGGLAIRDIQDGTLLSTVNVQADLVLPDDAAGTIVAVQGNTLDLVDQSSGSLLQTVTLPPLSGNYGSYGEEPVAVDTQSGRIYALTQNDPGRLQLLVLDGSNGATIDSIDLRQPAGSGAVAVDATHQRLAIIAQPGDGQSPVFIDVDTGSDTVVAQAVTPCSAGGSAGVWQTTVDPTSGRFYCVDPGDDAASRAPAVYVWDLTSGQGFAPLTLSGVPQSAQVVGGYLLVPQDSTATIVGPDRRTPASSVSRACCGAQYFPSAHHNLRGPFLIFWKRFGGVDTFGYPQTEPFVEDGRTVQYTDRFVLEMVNGRVQTAPLSRYLVTQRSFDAAYGPPFGPGVRYFPTTQHTLSGRFLAWWRTHQGGTLLGAPISEPLVEGNGDGSGRRYLLQWFEKGRLEYHPENAGTRYEMQLGLVGLQALRQRGWKS